MNGQPLNRVMCTNLLMQFWWGLLSCPILQPAKIISVTLIRTVDFKKSVDFQEMLVSVLGLSFMSAPSSAQGVSLGSANIIWFIFSENPLLKCGFISFTEKNECVSINIAMNMWPCCHSGFESLHLVWFLFVFTRWTEVILSPSDPLRGKSENRHDNQGHGESLFLF